MQRSGLFGVLAAAALLAGVVARADEAPPPAASETQTPDGVVQPGAAQTPQGVVETPPVIPTPPQPSAVQSVAPEDAEAILGQRVTDQEGKDVGRLVDVLVDSSGQPQAAVIDFGGFMGVGNRKIAV